MVNTENTSKDRLSKKVQSMLTDRFWIIKEEAAQVQEDLTI